MDADKELAFVIQTILSCEPGSLIWKHGIAERVQSETGRNAVGMNEYIRSCIRGGNRVRQSPETRSEWCHDFSFTYRIILPLFTLFLHGYFIEFRLENSEPDEATVMIVSGHPQIP